MTKCHYESIISEAVKSMVISNRLRVVEAVQHTLIETCGLRGHQES